MPSYDPHLFPVTRRALNILMSTLLASSLLTAEEISPSSKIIALEDQKNKVNTQAKKAPRDRDLIHNTATLVDRAVDEDLTSENLTPLPLVDDAKFMRRSYIGIIGRIPTFLEAHSFLHNDDPDKRSKLIDKLVYSPGYDSKMFNFWADMLRLKSTHEEYGLGWHFWLRDSITNNKPYDKMVYEMLSARGHAAQNPAVGYYLRDRNMLLDNISNSTQVFLGTQIGCAQCHDDPFEDRTQKEYYELAAFAANIDYRSSGANQKIRETAITVARQHGHRKINTEVRKPRNKEEQKRFKEQNKKFDQFVKSAQRDLNTLYKNFNKNEISYNDVKSLVLPKDYKYNDAEPGDVVEANPLFESIPGLEEGPDKLENFAKWMTHPANPQFTKNIANRLWRHVFGYGLAEPVDNWTDRTKVAHPEALAIVEKILRTNGYNIRETLRILYHTQLFQRSVSDQEVKPGSIYAFQGPVLRRLSAEELFDSYLTLEKGNVDANQNHQLRKRWNTYKQSIDFLLNIKPNTLVKIDKLADSNELQVKQYQAKVRALQLEITKLKGGKNAAKLKAVEKERRDTIKKMNELKKNSAKLISQRVPEASSMVEMSTMGNLQYAKTKNEPLRASEIPSPRNGDAFLRMFGASDRHTSNAAHTDSSIPQTLTLLNGKQIVQLTDKKGEILELIRDARTTREKLNVLFIGIYSRYPTPEEHIKFQPLLENKQTRALAKAMLNSKNFLFLQ